MSPEQILLLLQKKNNFPVLYLYGEEPYKINIFIKKIKEILYGTHLNTSFCIDHVEGSESSGAEVLELIQSIGFLGGTTEHKPRLVIVKQASELKKIEILSNALMETNSGSSPWGENLLILIAQSLDGRRKFHQWLKKQDYALEFKRCSDVELFQWADVIAKNLKANLSPTAKKLLCILSEGYLYRLSTEIEKAWAYASAQEANPDAISTQKNCVIEDSHVRAVSSSSMHHQMFDLIQAFLEKKRTACLLMTQALIQSSEDALGFVGFLTWTLKYPRNQKIKDPKPTLLALVQLDQQLKTLSIDPKALVEQFIIRVC